MNRYDMDRRQKEKRKKEEEERKIGMFATFFLFSERKNWRWAKNDGWVDASFFVFDDINV